MRTWAAALVAVALLLSGCSGTEEETDQPVATMPAGQQTDESLAALLPRVTINGQPLEAFPVATVREAGAASLPEVTPEACSFVATGLLNPILDGTPGAMALTTARINVTLVEMGTVEAAQEMIAERDFVLDSGQCSTVTVTQSGTPSQSTISEEQVGESGMEQARALVSTATEDGRTASSVSLLGRKGSVLILVNNGVKNDVEPLRQVAEHLAGQLP
ncbi:hypothetical protein [Aestuariimicrobium sp. Y1814]|uniref:hypothetical protein n=1 Tax=Aestuariimicrobium sp. Y1814 TaxID=3418742 RepID=UPI003DA6EFB1